MDFWILAKFVFLSEKKSTRYTVKDLKGRTTGKYSAVTDKAVGPEHFPEEARISSSRYHEVIQL